MALALFDLDNTLLAGDSDYLWGEFLVRHGHVDALIHSRENERFLKDYETGNLDMLKFLEFQLRPLKENSEATLTIWHQQFMEEDIKPILLDKARNLVEKHRKRGDTLVVITATNRFITAPIVKEYKIPHLIATEPERTENGYTGNVSGTPCFQAGKIEKLNEWLSQHKEPNTPSWFYSDSHNDIPLLEQVSHPIAVDPDEKLLAHAQQKGWQIMSLR